MHLALRHKFFMGVTHRGSEPNEIRAELEISLLRNLNVILVRRLTREAGLAHEASERQVPVVFTVVWGHVEEMSVTPVDVLRLHFGSFNVWLEALETVRRSSINKVVLDVNA